MSWFGKSWRSLSHPHQSVLNKIFAFSRKFSCFKIPPRFEIFCSVFSNIMFTVHFVWLCPLTKATTRGLTEFALSFSSQQNIYKVARPTYVNNHHHHLNLHRDISLPILGWCRGASKIHLWDLIQFQELPYRIPSQVSWEITQLFPFFMIFSGYYSTVSLIIFSRIFMGNYKTVSFFQMFYDIFVIFYTTVSLIK